MSGSLGRVPIGLSIAAVHPVVEADVALVLEIGVHRELEQNALHFVLVTWHLSVHRTCHIRQSRTTGNTAHGLHVLDGLAMRGQVALCDDDLAVGLHVTRVNQ